MPNVYVNILNAGTSALRTAAASPLQQVLYTCTAHRPRRVGLRPCADDSVETGGGAFNAIDGQHSMHVSTPLLLLPTSMGDRQFTVVGHGNIVGGTLTNVGNQTTNYYMHPQHGSRFPIPVIRLISMLIRVHRQLDSRVACLVWSPVELGRKISCATMPSWDAGRSSEGCKELALRER